MGVGQDMLFGWMDKALVEDKKIKDDGGETKGRQTGWIFVCIM
jgi:hypothetical protein